MAETSITIQATSISPSSTYAEHHGPAANPYYRLGDTINISFNLSSLLNKKINRIDSIVYNGNFTFNGGVLPNTIGMTAPPSIYVGISYYGSVYLSSGTRSFTISNAFNVSNVPNILNISIYPYASGLLVYQTATLSVSSSSIVITGDFEEFAPLAPTNLSPTTPQDPRSPITFAWIFNNAPGSPFTQTGSEIEYNEIGGETKTISLSTAINQYTFPANTFTTQQVTFRVRNKAGDTWGAWSNYASFQLTNTPPLAPTLVYPLNVSVSGLNGVLLEWRYNSPFDTFPSRFDIRYRVDGGSWRNKTNYSSGGNPAYSSSMTDSITTQSKVEWQVMAFGAVGDAGPWSEIGTFFTIGVPNAPVIVRVSNSNRPTIYFSATNLMSWQLEIRLNDVKIYETGNQPFLNEFSHVTNQFFENGNYLARMRVTNEYGLTSEWGTLPFTINTVAPEALKLQIVSNPNFNMRLHFNNTAGKTVYIYRSELRKNNYLRIGRTTGNMFDDYTVRPGNLRAGVNIRYEYFVRVVNPDFSFADSNIETGSLRFLETTLAEYDNPQNMIMLKWQFGQPTKDISFGFEKTLTQFVGREFPVLQVGEHANKSLSLSFYCSIADYERLEEMHRSYNVLLLRDWRLGSIYGTINGTLSTNRETNGYIVSFVFSRVDFDEEVELI